MAQQPGFLDISKLLGVPTAPAKGGTPAPAKGTAVPPGAEAFKAAVPLVPISKDVVDAATQKVSKGEYQKVSAATAAMEDSMPPLMMTGTRIYAMSFEELSKLAVLEVKVPQTSGLGSPNDKRLGVLEGNELCGTCKKTNMDCPGHLGMITLRRKYLNPPFAKAAIWVLMCVCNSCGRLLVTKSQIEKAGLNAYRGADKLQKLAEICVKTPCRHRLGSVLDEDGDEEKPAVLVPPEERRPCTMNPTYNPSKMKDSYIVMQEYNDKASGKTSVEISIGDIKKVFKQIPRSDLRLMGFEDGTHPIDFILEGLPVIPPKARPHVYQDGERKDDYFTTAYCDIIRYNNFVAQKSTAYDEDAENNRRKVERNLYFFISHFMDNTDKKYTRVKDEPILSIKDRMGTKFGYVRGYAMGKRVNYCLRTVLGPGRLRFGEIRLPERSRKVLTVPETITRYNQARLLKAYKAGEITHLAPGAGRLKGRRFGINDKTRATYTPQIGDKVDRWSEDGDPCIFNRQPTLHKQSFLGNKGKYGPEETIGIHSSTTTPHNADFDGDEGNIHKPQTVGAQCETLMIAGTIENVPNAQANRPMMGMVYNAISSAYMMSDPTVSLSEREWELAITNLDDHSALDAGVARSGKATQGVALASWASLNDRLAKHGVPQRSGRALFSTLLPPDFYYNSDDVKIRDGVLKSGQLTKKHVGPAAGSIIHYLWKMYPKTRVARFFTECQFVCDWFIEMRGLTIGYKDCHAANANQIRDIINREIVQTQLKIDSLGPETPDMTQLEKDFREKQVQNFLNTLAKIGRDIGLEALAKDNPLNIMSHSGAKGNDTNTAQITGLLGQQYIKGARPKRVMTHGTRCLPYYEPNSTSIEAGGFIYRNFADGIGPADMVFHMMAARIGLIETATKTAETGFIHRKLSKVLEDVKIAYTGSVVNASGVHFQYCFSDGFNGGELLPTYSAATGSLVSFIDLKNVVSSLNAGVDLAYDYV